MEDVFWYESSSSQQNFFDDEDDVTLSESDIFCGVSPESNILPINSIISNKYLKIILDESDSMVQHTLTPPEETIKRMFYGENFILNVHKTLEHKLELLDAAINIGDGNVILTVVLFLMKSLSNNIFFTQMTKRKIAINHYVNYLIDKNGFQELADLYMATGNIMGLNHIYCLLSKDNSNQHILLKKLEQFNLHHAQNMYSLEDRLELQDNISLIEFQIKHNLNCNSLVDCLMHLCTSEWKKGNGDELISDFKKRFKVDDFQYDWVVMSVCCKLKNWDKLLSTFMKSVWVLKKRALKSIIRPELFILAIGRHEAPEPVIEQFLSCVSDVSKCLSLAEKLKIHNYVINYYMEQKDKTALLKYMEKVQPGSQAMCRLQSSINNPDIKWKN